MKEKEGKSIDSRVNCAPENFRPEKDLPAGFYDLLCDLHRDFTPRQQEIIKKRREILELSHQGQKPNHLPKSESGEENWRVELPDFAKDQRNQMTGPADDAELCVKMLNSGAPGRNGHSAVIPLLCVHG